MPRNIVNMLLLGILRCQSAPQFLLLLQNPDKTRKTNMKIEPIQTDKFLSVDDTRIMKAVAICLMLMHHLWCFSTRTAGEPQ